MPAGRERRKTVNLETNESRRMLSKMVIRLFRLWRISTADQLNLLGLSENSRGVLSKYAHGEALPFRRDMLDRVGLLLSVHKALKLLYPRNEEIRYSWVSRRNTAFDNLTPLAVMKEQGIIGISRVSLYLESCICL